MLNIDVKFSGDTKERIEALINGFDKKRGVLMGKIAKRMEVDLRNKFLSNGGRSRGLRCPTSARKYRLGATGLRRT